MNEWLHRDAALSRLKVKPQTLYAYAARGRIEVRPDPDDHRRSLYNAADIAALASRRARGRKPATIAASSMAWGEPSLATGLSTVDRGRLVYRGRDVVELARAMALEEVAQLLWQVPQPIALAGETEAGADSVFAVLAGRIPSALPMLARGRTVLAAEAAELVGTLAALCGAAAGGEPLHGRLAYGWGRPNAAEAIRVALVLMADHDLNASTFATRVAASTGASLPACILAGLCTLSGPRHGGAAAALHRLIAEARQIGCEAAIESWLAGGIKPPGFGHPLYPQGDPRAALMLEGLVPDPLHERFRQAMFARTGQLPNCDFGLMAMTKAFDLPEDAPFRLFLIGRSVGWCAHAIEQNESGTLIRPLGRYTGPLPEPG